VRRVFDQGQRPGRRNGCIALTLLALLASGAADANAQCSPRSVMQNFKRLWVAPATLTPPPRDITSAATTPVWKTISIGTTASTLVLRDALATARCGVGDLAEQILWRPAFSLSPARIDVDLVSVSAADLGFRGRTAPLAGIYAQAKKLGFELAAAEIGPQLRLQYFFQPIGEFLHIAMEPIRTWTGEPVIFVVGNGGEGLILIGQDGDAEAEIPVTSRFVFVRRRDFAEAARK
jgi:hypothetical protein